MAGHLTVTSTFDLHAGGLVQLISDDKEGTVSLRVKFKAGDVTVLLLEKEAFTVANLLERAAQDC